MKILVTGSTGLVGSALVPYLTRGGHQVVRMVRKRADSANNEVQWDPEKGTIDSAGLEGADAVVHLAGENIAEGRWTEEKKRRIRESRVKGTALLSDALAKLKEPPKAFISASAIGFYGDRDDEILSEESKPGTDYLADVCREWEAATEPAKQKGIRTVNLRIGVVLSRSGGALAKMLLPFQIGVGGAIGNGKQYMSWIHIDDMIGVIDQTLTNSTLNGPVNAVAPNPVTNQEFTKTLGRVLSRPTLFTVPVFAARLAFGEMADAVLLSSTRVQPARILAAGYKFRYPELEGALRQLLEK
jgi:uncharacterized protein